MGRDGESAAPPAPSPTSCPASAWRISLACGGRGDGGDGGGEKDGAVGH